MNGEVARFLAAGVLALGGCFDPAARVLEVMLPEGASVLLEGLQTSPAKRVSAARRDGRTLQIEASRGAFTLRVPGMCPLAVPADAPATLAVVPLLRVPDTLAQVGFGAQTTLAVELGCPEAAAAEIVWRQVAGVPLADLRSEDHGRALHFRTAAREAHFPEPLPYGVVPVSPRTQGRAVLEAVLRIPGQPEQRQTVTVTAIARATGLSSVAVGQRLMLGGDGWHVTRSPRLGQAKVVLDEGIHTFTPDAAGRFWLADAAGKTLEIQALTHDRTPMDCARSECHAQLSRDALASPMSHAFALPFAPHDDATCALDCHTVGEPGLNDGGFRALARTLEVPLAPAMRFDDLPHALQRLAGVRCTSCHGPGAVPAHAGRSRILRADVCATCHDAPPTYTHVLEWRSSRMAKSDASSGQRDEPACARCHTTGGFLHARGIRERADLSRDADGAAVGIACAACHATHGAHVGKSLVRALPSMPSLPSPELAGTSSNLCAQCHAPDLVAIVPAASAAALWGGRVTLPEGFRERALSGDAPHAAISGGCLGCHGKQAAPTARRHTEHGFGVDAKLCTTCHDAGMNARVVAEGTTALVARAAETLKRIEALCGSGRPHTTPHALAAAPCPTEALTRARYGARLVAEDPAAYVHNAPFARGLLDAADAAITACADLTAPGRRERDR